MVDDKQTEQEDIEAALHRVTLDGSGDITDLPDGDFEGEDSDG